MVWDDAQWNAKSPTQLQATMDAGTMLCRSSCLFASECSKWPIERTSECCVYSKLLETLQLYFGHDMFPGWPTTIIAATIRCMHDQIMSKHKDIML